MYYFSKPKFPRPRIANFSNQARKRLLKQALLRAKGLDVDQLGYAAAMQTARGKAGQPIRSSSPFVRDLANSNYLSDPGDLSYINRLFNDTIKNSPIDYGESGAMVLKVGKGISPTAKEAKKSIRNIATQHMGTQPGVRFIPPDSPLPNQARGIAMIHTHPLSDASPPSLQDALTFPMIRTMTDTSTMSQALLKPGAPIDAYVAHRTRPGKYDLTKYGDNRNAYSPRSQQFLFDADDATRQQMLEQRILRISPVLRRQGVEDPIPIIQQAVMGLITPTAAIRKYNPEKLYSYLTNNTPRAFELSSNIPEDAIRSTQSSLWTRLKNDKELLSQRKEISRVASDAFQRMGFDAKYLGRYNVPGK